MVTNTLQVTSLHGEILAKGLMTGANIAITSDTHAYNVASNTNIIRGHCHHLEHADANCR